MAGTWFGEAIRESLHGHRTGRFEGWQDSRYQEGVWCSLIVKADGLPPTRPWVL